MALVVITLFLQGCPINVSKQLKDVSIDIYSSEPKFVSNNQADQHKTDQLSQGQ